jgi:hypothetical protein
VKGFKVVLAIAAWWMFGVAGVGCSNPPTPKEIKEAASCTALAAELTERLRNGQACDQARVEAQAKFACPWPIKCPGDEIE